MSLNNVSYTFPLRLQTIMFFLQYLCIEVFFVLQYRWTEMKFKVLNAWLAILVASPFLENFVVSSHFFLQILLQNVRLLMMQCKVDIDWLWSMQLKEISCIVPNLNLRHLVLIVLTFYTWLKHSKIFRKAFELYKQFLTGYFNAFKVPTLFTMIPRFEQVRKVVHHATFRKF